VKPSAIGVSSGYFELRFPASALVDVCRVAVLVGLGLLALGCLGLRWERGYW
jgi:hypothetical protein